jgi:hypothetical protein
LQANEDRVCVAVIIVVAHGKAASVISITEYGARRLLYVPKNAPAVITEKQRRFPIGHVGTGLFNDLVEPILWMLRSAVFKAKRLGPEHDAVGGFRLLYGRSYAE